MHLRTRPAHGFLMRLLLMAAMAVLLVSINRKAVEDSIGGDTALLTGELCQRMKRYICHKSVMLLAYSAGTSRTGW